MKSVLASYTLELGGVHPDQRLDGRPLWNAPGVRLRDRPVHRSARCCAACRSDIHLLVACRILQGCGGAMMVPVGRLTLVRTFAKSELVRAMSFVAVPGLIGPMLGPIAGGLIVAYLQLALHLFLNLPIGIAGPRPGLPASARLSRRKTKPLDMVGLSCSGPASRCCRTCWRYSASTPWARAKSRALAISLVLIVGYGLLRGADRVSAAQLSLFRIRTFSAAVSGGFFTRLGIGGVPFLLPLLYQVGLGFTPVQSGLLDHAPGRGRAGTKFVMPQVLERARLSDGADLQHGHPRLDADAVRDDRPRDAGLG